MNGWKRSRLRKAAVAGVTAFGLAMVMPGSVAYAGPEIPCDDADIRAHLSHVQDRIQLVELADMLQASSESSTGDPTCDLAIDLLVAVMDTAIGCVTGALDGAGLHSGAEPPVTSLFNLDCEALVRDVRPPDDIVVEELVEDLVAFAGVVEALAADVLARAQQEIDRAPSLSEAIAMATDVVLYFQDLVSPLPGADAPPSEHELLTAAAGAFAFLWSDSDTLSLDPHIPVSYEQLVAYAVEPLLYVAQPALGGDFVLEDQVLLRHALLVKATIEGQLDTAEESLLPPNPANEVEKITPLSFPSGFEDADVADRLGAEFGGRFAGTWIVNDIARDLLAVGVKDASTADEARVAALLGPHAQYVKVVRTTYSEAELLDFHERVLALLPVESTAAFDFIGSGPDIPSNQVLVQFIKEPAGFRAQALQAVPSNALRILVRTGVAGQTSESYESFPPYKAGKRIRDRQVRGSCTSGFMYVGSSNPPEPYGSTAGHCTLSNGQIRTDYRDRDYIGSSFNDRFYGRSHVQSDSALIALDDDDDATNRIYVNSSQNRRVIGFLNQRAVSSGRVLCMRGKTTGVRCGVVGSTNQTRQVYMDDLRSGTTHIFYVHHLVCWDGETNGGDSGGPVYYIPDGGRNKTDARAVGINSWGSDLRRYR